MTFLGDQLNAAAKTWAAMLKRQRDYAHDRLMLDATNGMGSTARPAWVLFVEQFVLQLITVSGWCPTMRTIDAKKILHSCAITCQPTSNSNPASFRGIFTRKRSKNSSTKQPRRKKD